MNYYTAPMEGLTDRIWRQAHQRWFGAPGAPARYYAPFISPPENRVLIKKKMAELDPAANPGAPVIPQLLAKDGALAAWMIGELRKMGYTEVNLNFGCPSGTVTAKGKGAGMLRDLSKLEVFLDEVFSQAEGPISVKTRLGVTSPEEFEAILDLYDRCPICELTIHPRVMRQLYRGEADRAAFAKYLPHCRMPVCYNGDITTPAQLKALEADALVYFVMSALVKWQGVRVIERLFPPVVIGPVIILIGLSLAGTGVNMAKENWVLALLSLVTAVVVSMKAKGLLKLIPIFCGIIVGYLAAWLFYDLDLSGVRDAAWIGLPQFVFPKFSWEPILFMIPVAIAPVIEHIGDVYVVNTVTGKDFVKDPGLHRTLLGDGLACCFAGLVGAGRTELMDAIFGVDKVLSGSIELNGKKLHIHSPKDAMNHKIALVPEERKRNGLVLIQDLYFNTSLCIFDQLIKFGRIDRKRQEEIMTYYKDKFKIKTPSFNQMAGNLSGGNQQKVVLSKELSVNPMLLILDEPTRGIDVGAKAEIYRIISDLAAEGMSVICVSSELPEIINLCHRVCVMANGKIVKIIDDPAEMTQNRIMEYALGGKS